MVGCASVAGMSPERSRYCATMKIKVRGTDGSVDVSVSLTEDEADGLAGALRSRLDGEAGYRGPGYHLHIEDGEGSELTVVVLDPE